MWRVRKAQDDEAPACRALLPDLFPTVGYAPELTVAVGEAQGVIGAAGVVFTEGGFPLSMAVAPGWRWQGIGAALLDAVIDQARGETHALRTASPVEADGPIAAFLAHRGFVETRRFLRFETEGVDGAVILGGLLARASGAAPTVVSMRQAPIDQAIALLATTFDAAPFAVARRLASGVSGYDLDLSVAALDGDRVIGAMVCTRTEDRIDIDLNVVAPDHRRGGLVNLALLEAIARFSADSGVKRYAFSCEPHVRDTRNLARRWNAAELPPTILMARALNDG